jgi:hypothetical protein
MSIVRVAVVAAIYIVAGEPSNFKNLKQKMPVAKSN